jgi:hypothetical protein
VAFFQRCKAGLRPGGLIFVKENIAQSGARHMGGMSPNARAERMGESWMGETGYVIDEQDSSVTRSVTRVCTRTHPLRL